MVGPDYHRPQAYTPAQWGEALAGGETNAPVISAAWWKNFNDPEMDSLIERAVHSNLDLRIAQARVREARAVAGSLRQFVADRGQFRFLCALAGKQAAACAGLAAGPSGCAV
jgi:outer membrane protein TolC